MSWVGTAMYVAFAIGAPLGNALYTRYGFIAIAAATALVPLGALLFVAPMRAIIPNAAPTSRSFTKVIGAVWMPGIGLALSSIGFGAITTFIARAEAVGALPALVAARPGGFRPSFIGAPRIPG